MKKKKEVNLTSLGKLTPVQTRSFRYPRFIPVHQELMQCGIREIDVMLYGLYESCTKSFGAINASGQAYIRITNKWAAQQLNVSSSTAKCARNRLVGYGLIVNHNNGRNKPSDTILFTWTQTAAADPTVGKQTYDVDEFFQAAIDRSYRSE